MGSSHQYNVNFYILSIVKAAI